MPNYHGPSITSDNTRVILVGTRSTERQFDSDDSSVTSESEPDREGLLSEEEDVEMDGAQYFTAEEAEAAQEAQNRIQGLGIRLGEEIVD